MVEIGRLFVCLCFNVLLSLAAASLLESLVIDIDPCEDVCQKTYSLHTYDKSLPGACCSRGCRLHSILELIVGDGGINETLKSCYDNCQEAYPSKEEESSACILGCRSQKPFTEKWGNLDIDSNLLAGGMPRMMYPLLSMHKLYSSMVDTATQRMSISWSFFMQGGIGRLVVMKSQPPLEDMDIQDLDDYSVVRETSSVLETNIEASDNTATQVLRHSQLKSAAKSARHEVNTAEASPWANKMADGNSNDWLTCIARKTGVPRPLLSIFILLSAIALIWLCMSAAVTSPEHRPPQKLSIRSDLDYLRSLPDKKCIKGILPQDVLKASPLPFKLTIEQI